MRTLPALCLALTIVFVAGCGKDKEKDKEKDSLPTTHEGYLDEMQKVIDESSDFADKIKTKEDLEKHKDDLNRLANRASALAEQAKKFDKMTDEEKEKLAGKGLKLFGSFGKLRTKVMAMPADVRAEVQKIAPQLK